MEEGVCLLLARGRDRLETTVVACANLLFMVSYSLGDAIDWKLNRVFADPSRPDAINLLLARGRDRLETLK